MLALIHSLAQVPFAKPHIDYHALAPEIVLTVLAVSLLIADLFIDETRKYVITTIAGVGVIAALIPIVTLAVDGSDRSLFGGAYVVDNFALLLKALFLVAGYLTLLMSSNYLQEGDYYEGEFSFLVVCSLLGMVVMASSRDLITIFVALETLSIPGYLLAGWRKRDRKSNEAALKYYLLGVVASAIMLYGMSLVYGITGSTLLIDIGAKLPTITDGKPLAAIGILMVIIGFAFKVSAVPFHQWAPDTYEGAPTPVTAFLSVASKAAGFVALMELIFIGFVGRPNVWAPIFWVLAALTMTVGNLIALRQTNIVRLLAYSGIAQAGYMLVPFAVAGDNNAAQKSAFTAILVYLISYAAMTLGAFMMVIAIARKTRSGEISSLGGLFEYAPGLTVVMSVFVASLIGIPPLVGFWGKLFVFRAVLDAGTGWALFLGVIASVNAVIALGYYGTLLRTMWMKPVPDGDRRPIKVPQSLVVGLAICALAVVAGGIYPQVFTRFGDLARFF